MWKPAAREIRDLLERLDSNEGASEGMADVWEDYLMTPQNVNRMHFDDLVSLPNVSAIDAVAILNRVARGDTIADMRDLRNSVGLSHYGYTNLRSYVYYREPPVKNAMLYDAQMQFFNPLFLRKASYESITSPSCAAITAIRRVTIEHKKDLAYWGYFNLDELDPDIVLKLRARYGNNYKIGLMNYTGKGESSLLDRNATEVANDSKFYAGYENSQLPWLGNTRLKLYLGHYRATFGEGLVMENTDFYSARKTGFGFSKRIMGISPDLSRTQEFALRGAAVEINNPMVNVQSGLLRR
jgi:hypothetical protein